ncbi:MAG TPA: 3-dehydroquinate synthase II [Methanocorpusculum sp.]|nr:3-dehydroquinate synthase II [Methanocorpusculum sp.]
MTKEILIRADTSEDFDERKKTAEQALENGFTNILLCFGDEKLADLGKYNVFYRNGCDISSDMGCGKLLRIASPEDLEKAYGIKADFLILETTDWKVIPLENLIAHFQKSGTKLFVSAESAEDARLFLQTMECGCDGICILGKRLDEFKDLIRPNHPDIFLEEAVITKITPLGLGDRVCIDTCSLLNEGDSMFIGSQSAALFCVCSESFENGYVAPRPFRVNAGAVHSYILNADDSTNYLSEIKSGARLLVRSNDGSIREVYAGRVKCEVRPLLLIEAKARSGLCSVILQNAETVRLLTTDGAKSVSKLKEGDHAYIRAETGGRHFGHLMSETIVEK